MSSRKNDIRPSALDYLIEDEPLIIKHDKCAAFEEKIKDLEEEIEKLEQINNTLREELSKALGFTK